jgi:hypothetical protein
MSFPDKLTGVSETAIFSDVLLKESESFQVAFTCPCGYPHIPKGILSTAVKKILVLMKFFRI